MKKVEQEKNQTSSSRTMNDYLRYKFDDFLSRGGSSSFLALTIVFVGLFTVVATARALFVVWQGGLERLRTGVRHVDDRVGQATATPGWLSTPPAR